MGFFLNQDQNKLQIFPISVKSESALPRGIPCHAAIIKRILSDRCAM